VSNFDRQPTQLESDIQSDIIDFAHIRGWFAVKIVSPSRKGIMDVYALRNGRHVWIEVKRPGEVLREQQAKVAREMKAHGARDVYAVDSLEQARAILK